MGCPSGYNDTMLSYKNENDRCYGATGMAIGLVVFDGEDMLAGVSLDAPAHAMMDMAQDFFFAGNPSLSAKAAWTRMVRNFNLMAAMMISNVMCRRIVLEESMIDSEMREFLRSTILREAADNCSLEDDEANRLFEKDYNFLHKVFNHRGVQDVAHDFARKLSQARTFTRAEMLEELRGLSSL